MAEASGFPRILMNTLGFFSALESKAVALLALRRERRVAGRPLRAVLLALAIIAGCWGFWVVVGRWM